MANGRQGATITGAEEDYAMDDAYISRDAGLSWQKVHQGPAFYDIGDQGGVLVKSSQDTDVDEISFSWDLGYHWRSINLPFLKDSRLSIRSLRADPGKLGMRFIAHGLLRGPLGANHKSFFLTVDFSSLFNNSCELADDADYEEWVPSFPSGECILGKRLAYIRRKPYVLCYNPDDMEAARIKNYCFCTESDWECEAEYFRDPKTGKCVLWDSKLGTQVQALPAESNIPDNCKDYYLVKSGYRKLADSGCERGIDLSGQIFPCPAHRNIK
jgi:Sortilin, neurotensin receptor 3, C-terminal/Sortilin, neurotensin receptor 3,